MVKNLVCPLQCGLPVTHDLNKIIVHGAKEHNLKNICFEIPKGKLVVLTGPSGSGKSSIATDILQKECIRQYLESLGMMTDHIEKAKVDSITGLSPSIGVSQRVADFNPRSTVGTRTGILTILRNMFAAMGSQPCRGCGQTVKQPLQDKHKLTTVEIEEQSGSTVKTRKKSYFACPQCNHHLEKLQMAHFSFNALSGACEACKGVGDIINVDIARLLNEEKTLRSGGVAYWNESLAKYYENVIVAASRHYNFPFDPTIPIGKYTQEQKDFLLYGIDFPVFATACKSIAAPKKVSEGNFEGVVTSLLNQYKKNPTSAANDVTKYIVQEPCTTCNNTRLSKLGREVTVGSKTISNVTKMSLNELLAWLHELDSIVDDTEKPVLSAFSGALKDRISNVIEVGLYYLTLDRTLPSLSAGESQRLKLAGLLSSGLSGVLYVLDEPTTGLHPHDTAKLLRTLKKIQEAGNTVLVIEHDMEVVEKADYVIDIGPGGGSKGGEIIASGTPMHIKNATASSTANYLAKKVALKPNVALSTGSLTIRGASEHNLKNIDVSIPVQQFVVMTGVSGSGKSTFLFDIVDKIARRYFNNASDVPGKHTSVHGLDHFRRIVTVDQVTIGNAKSSRSNVATYTKLFDLVRDLFAALPEAKRRGFTADKFSFNTSNERCQNCNGAGTVAVDMTFMPDIETGCPACNGRRFTEELLAVQFQGHTIADVLDMSVSEAIDLFRQGKKIFAILDLMNQVGLGYLKLGQSTSTLSGGEAQRIKLAAELAKPDAGNTLDLMRNKKPGLTD